MFDFLLTNDLFRASFSEIRSQLFSTGLGNLRNLKVKMIVVAAPRIELRSTRRTAGVTLHVLENREHCTAGAAEYCILVPFTLRPDRYRMIGERLVAILAGIVLAATFHLDGNDVSRPVIMLTTGLRVEIYATHARRSQRHRFSLTLRRE